MATPAAPDTTDKTGSTSDESKGGLFNTGDATVLTTLSSAIAADVTAAQASADEAAGSATTASEKATAAATSATAAATSATAAASSATDAANTLDAFDDRYLGNKSSDPSVDNDGNALLTGALYFKTTDNIMRVYTGSAWTTVKPTTTEQGHINTVSGIQANVTTVAGISSDVTAVAGKATEVGLLGVASVITDMGILGTSAVVTDMDLLGTSANVTAMGHLGTSANVTAMGLLGTSAVVEDMGILGTSAVVTDMDLLGTSANVTAMGLLGTSAVVADMALLGTSAVVTDMDLLGTSANVTAMGHLGTSANVTAMGLLGTSAVVTDMGLLGTSANVTAMGNLGTSTNVTNMANLNASGVISNIATVSGAVTNVNTVASNISHVSTVSGAIANVNTVATNITNVNTFANTYFIASSAPTGGTIGEGDLWYDTANDEMKVHNGSSFVTFISTYDTDNLSEGSSNLYYTDTRADARITNAFNNNVTLAGELRGPATFVIDPAVVGNNTGLVQIKGSLQVDGTTTTVNSQTLDVADKNITVADGAANKAAADGGGLTVDCGSDTDATLTYASSDDTWNVNKTLKVNSDTVATQGFAVAMAIAL